MRKTLLSVLMATAFVSPMLSVGAHAQDVQTAQNGERERGGAWQRRFGGTGAGAQPQQQREARQEQRQERQEQRQEQRQDLLIFFARPIFNIRL